MLTHFLPWLIAGIATRFTINFLLRRWLSIRLALPWGIAFALFSLALLATWLYTVALPIGLIAGIILIDLLRVRP